MRCLMLNRYPCSHAEALKELEYPVKLQKLLLTPQREVLVELVITKDRQAPLQDWQTIA